MADFFEQIGNFFNDLFTNLLNFLWDFLFLLCELLFGWINIPAFPSGLKTSIEFYLDIIFNNLSLVGFFIRPTTLQIAIPIVIFIMNFKYIYKISMWIIKKIPFINMK